MGYHKIIHNSLPTNLVDGKKYGLLQSMYIHSMDYDRVYCREYISEEGHW
jgi:hypothetical protein